MGRDGLTYLSLYRDNTKTAEKFPLVIWSPVQIVLWFYA